MEKITLSISGVPIEAPGGVPTGGIDTGQRIIQVGINLLFVTGVLIAIIIIIYSGIQWILSGGDKEKLASARARLTYTFIGLLAIILAFTIVKFTLTALGYNASFFLNF